MDEIELIEFIETIGENDPFDEDNERKGVKHGQSNDSCPGHYRLLDSNLSHADDNAIRRSAYG